MGGMISGYGQVFLGNAAAGSQQDELVAQTKAADLNLQLQAMQAREQGAFAAGKIRMDAGQRAGEQKVAYAASGVDPTSGTAAAVQADSRALGELDAQQNENNARRAAWGFEESRKTLQEMYQAKKAQIQQGRTGSIMTGSVNAMNSLMSFGMGGGGGGG